jgi:hypothetical protein
MRGKRATAVKTASGKRAGSRKPRAAMVPAAKMRVAVAATAKMRVTSTAEMTTAVAAAMTTAAVTATASAERRTGQYGCKHNHGDSDRRFPYHGTLTALPARCPRPLPRHDASGNRKFPRGRCEGE